VVQPVVVATDRVRGVDRGGAAAKVCAHGSVQLFIQQHPGTSGAASVRRPPFRRGRRAALSEPVLDGLHHPVGRSDSHRPPRLYWTRHSTPAGIGSAFKTRPATRCGRRRTTRSACQTSRPPGLRHSIGLARWWHLGTNVLWLLNGLVFYVLLFATGQWRHLIPTSWTSSPTRCRADPISVAGLALEGHWVAYNGLQLLAYFVTVFIAAPAR